MRAVFGMAPLLVALGCVIATSGCGRRPQYPSCALSPSVTREKIRSDAPARLDPRLLRDGYVLELRGDSRKCGTVIHLRNMHRWEGLTSEQETMVARYQLLVLRELEKLKPKTLFLEDFTEALRTYREKPVFSQQYDEWIRLFGKGIPDQPTDEQLRMLYDHGAGEAYAALHSEVSMQMTITEARYLELQPEITSAIEEKRVFESKVIFDDRENEAVRHIRQYLTDHPGEIVVLIYGASHKFADNIAVLPEPRPVLYSKNFPVPFILTK